MKIIIKATNIKLSPAFKQYIVAKINNLEKLIPVIDSVPLDIKKSSPLVEAWVEVGRTTRHHQEGKVFRAEVQIRLSGKGVRAEAEADDIRQAVNIVKDELERELKKYKGVKAAGGRRGARILKEIFRFSPLARFRRKKGGRKREEGL